MLEPNAIVLIEHPYTLAARDFFTQNFFYLIDSKEIHDANIEIHIIEKFVIDVSNSIFNR